jgi:hypothetical protein
LNIHFGGTPVGATLVVAQFQYQSCMKIEYKNQRQFYNMERQSIPTPIVIQLKMTIIAIKAD